MRLKFNDSPQTTYQVEVLRLNEHVVQILGDIPGKTCGFQISRDRWDDNWDYSDFTTIFREIEGGYQYSDNGTIYIPPTKSVTIRASFTNTDPFDVEATVYINGVEENAVTLDADNEYAETFIGVPAEDVYTVTAPEVEDLVLTINGTNINYYHEEVIPVDPTPSTEEQLEDLMVALCDLDERVYALENA